MVSDKHKEEIEFAEMYISGKYIVERDYIFTKLSQKLYNRSEFMDKLEFCKLGGYDFQKLVNIFLQVVVKAS